MKTEINFSTGYDDEERFSSREDLLDFLGDMDGVELLVVYDKPSELVFPQDVMGLHMSSFYCWLDLWEGNEEGLLHEFGSLEAAESYYGGLSRQTLIDRFKKDVAWARQYEANYMVFHVAENWSSEYLGPVYHRTDEEVAAAACELLNAVLKDEEPGPALLMENLWEPGLTFLRPEIARDLLQGVSYANKGFMLDTGHLLHTNVDLTTEEEGVAYIHQILDGLDSTLMDAIRGMHLQQSITGAYVKEMRAKNEPLPQNRDELLMRVFSAIFNIDQHLPWTCKGVRGIVERVAPEYLTFEFITSSRQQLAEAIATQMEALA